MNYLSTTTYWVLVLKSAFRIARYRPDEVSTESLLAISTTFNISIRSMDVLKVALDCIGENNSNGPRSSEISQWTSLARTLKGSDLPGLDKSLTTRSYLVGNALSIADAAVYVALMTKEVDVTGYKNISRFVLHIQNRVKAVRGVKVLSPSTRPTFIPSTLMAVVAAPTPKKDTTTASAADGGKDKEADQGKRGKKEKKEKEGVSSSAPAPAPAADADLNPSLLDIRVGEVVKCWNHPDSEKLLCEEVDLGEATGPRNIASGIREFYSAEEFMGKKVSVHLDCVSYMGNLCRPRGRDCL